MFLTVRQLLISLAVPVIVALGSHAPVRAQEQSGYRLLLIEQAGCYYCRVFNRDVAPVYENAREGQAAPLMRANLRGPMPEDVTLSSMPFVTPTFILIGPDGAEVERLTGWPGDNFFWPYVTDMLIQAGALPAAE